MSKYQLLPTKYFRRSLKKLVDKGRVTKLKIKKILDLLEQNPFDKSLKTHKVTSKNSGQAFSSRIDSDLRIIWNFGDNDQIVIYLLDIGGHSGQGKVYN